MYVLMKAATGELNLTVITLIAIAAVLGFFWWIWPSIQESINAQWDGLNDREGLKDNAGLTYIVLEDFYN